MADNDNNNNTATTSCSNNDEPCRKRAELPAAPREHSPSPIAMSVCVCVCAFGANVKVNLGKNAWRINIQQNKVQGDGKGNVKTNPQKSFWGLEPNRKEKPTTRFFF